jgi:hypothetical protein
VEKINRNFIIVCIAVFCIFAGFIAGYFIGRANTTDNTGIERNLDRERELLERIGEYEQRERDRIARENQRINAERDRIRRTEAAIRAIRQSDRRSSDLLQELAKETEILADYFRDSRDIVNNGVNNLWNE